MFAFRRSPIWICAASLGGCLQLPDPVFEDGDTGATGAGSDGADTAASGGGSAGGSGTGTTRGGDGSTGAGAGTGTGTSGGLVGTTGGTDGTTGGIVTGGVGSASDTGATGDTGATDSGATSTTTSGDPTDTGDGGPTSGEATIGGGSSTGGVPMCDAGELCVPPVPDGWSGYAARGTDGLLTGGCPGSHPAVTPLNTGLIAIAADCSCECTNPTTDCGDLLLEFYAGASTCVTVGPQATISGPQNCTEVNFGANTKSKGRFVNVAPGGSCTAVPGEMVSDAVWGTRHAMCGDAATSGACGTGEDVCVTDPGPGFDADVCIHREGNLACPAEFPNRTVYYDDYEDTRACTQCGCGTLEDASCSATIGYTNGPDCFTLTAPPTTTGECVEHGGATWAQYQPPTVSGTCPPTGGAPTGQAEGTGPLTVCCM